MCNLTIFVAKRAYLSTLANPPAVFSSPTAETSATIRPYDGPDAQQIIAQVGYENTSYFYRLFRAHYGQSPREYRLARLEKK